MGWIEETISSISGNIVEAVRKFTAYSFLLVFIGTLYGYSSARLSAFTGLDPITLLIIPLVLSALAYFFAEIATVLFLLLLSLLVLIFI